MNMTWSKPTVLSAGCSGVYLQHPCAADGDVTYVGMSLTCVVGRSMAYASGCAVTVIPLDVADDMVRSIERYLIAAFQPELNKADRTTIDQARAIRWTRRNFPTLKPALLAARRRYRPVKQFMQFANEADSVQQGRMAEG